MLTSKPREPARVKMKCPAGQLIPRPDTAGQPKWMRFYNWPRDAKGEPLPDAPDFPRPEDVPEMIVDVPRDEHHSGLIVKGMCSVGEQKPKSKKGDK